MDEHLFDRISVIGLDHRRGCCMDKIFIESSLDSALQCQIHYAALIKLGPINQWSSHVKH